MDYEKISRSAKLRQNVIRGITYTLLTLWGILVLFPFYWMLLSSVKSYSAYNSEFIPQLFTLSPTLQNYADAFTTVPLGGYFLNTVIFTLATTAIMLIVTILAVIILCAVLQIPIVWYYIIGAILLGIFVAYASMYGFDKFKETWEPLAALAEENGVKIGFEGCGGGWHRGSTNIAFCSDAWELMFDAVPSKALGLEWEPCHIMEGLGDPIMQLRHWADRVVHLHGKDCTIAWDVIKEYGMRGPHPVVFNRTPGFGDTNWRDVFYVLHRAGYAGDVTIEGYHDNVYNGDWELTAQMHGLNYLKWCRGGDFRPTPWDK